MSATGRGAVRHKDDFYETPAWCARAIKPYLPQHNGVWVEPCVGSGAIPRALPDPRVGSWWLCDIEDLGCYLNYLGDFLEARPVWTPDVVITNPPFKLAAEFIRHARELWPSTPSWWLLRLNFLAGQNRQWLWKHVGVPDVYVLPKRPSFTGKGTDATEYAWFNLPGGKARTAGEVRILEVPQ